MYAPRANGEQISDQDITAEHPELMPELQEELRLLAIMKRAAAQSRDASSSGLGHGDGFALEGYTLIEEIHRGGQGVVYRALCDATQREVAVKVIHRSARGDRGEQVRFEREVSILESLDHPNIVRIHGSGSSSGASFLVMDYIRGWPLDTYPTTDQLHRLLLFIKICDAVHTAHLRGVIHRDLKPGNIRVDESGEPHVLDFGLSKPAADRSTANSAAVTMTGQFVGSLPWAAPEQVNGSSDGIDIRADVYALGVILYHMLTGRFPYDVTGPMREVLDRIIHADPVPLNASTPGMGDELNTIVLKTLDKNPARRYQSAGDLANDIRRYISGEVVEAKRDSAWYMFRKTLRRHRFAAAVAMTTILFVGATAIALGVMYRRQASALAQASSAMASEQQARARAERVTAFLTRTLGLADPDITQTPTLTMKDALDQASVQVEEAFAGQPQAEADVRLVIGRAYAALGELTHAEAHLARALDIRERSVQSTPQALYEIRWPYANVCQDLSRHDALYHWWQRWYLYPKMFADEHPDLAKAIVALGLTMGARFDEHKTWPAYDNLMHAAESLPDDDPQRLILADFLHVGGVSTGWKGFPEPACRFLQKALAIQRQHLPETNTRVTRTLGELIRYTIADRRYDIAETMTRESLDVLGTVLPPHHWYEQVQRARLGASLAGQGRFEDAEALLTESLAAIESSRGATNQFVRETVEYLITLYEQWPVEHEARAYRRLLATKWVGAEESIVIPQQLQPMFGAEYTALQAALDRFDCERQQAWAAGRGLPVESLAELLDLRRQLLADDHPLALALADWLHFTAQFRARRRGITEHTGTMVREAALIFRSSSLVHPWKKARCLISLARFLEHRGDYVEGDSTAKEALALYDAHGAHSGDPSIALSILGACLVGQQRFAEAETLLIRGYEELQASPYAGPRDRSTKEALSRVVSLYDAWGKGREAKDWRARMSLGD